MSFKCLHIADTHWRGLSRHEEYRKSFNLLFSRAKELRPDIIYIGGDIVHSKTQGISPELIDCLNWWFTEMAKIAPVHVILGNHDGLILNRHRQDAISPILNALDNPRIHLYKESGTYPTGIPGFNWCVFSCFDEDGWEDVRPVPNEVNIALYHGAVYGSKTDIDWDVEGEIEASFFNDYDFAFLGDIHRHQYLDKEKRIAYCGSTIQQNYGEDIEKGFLFWNIEARDVYKSDFYVVHNGNPHVTIDWAGDVGKTLKLAEPHPDGTRFRIRTNVQISQGEIQQLHSTLKEIKGALEIVFKHDHEYDSSVIKTLGGELFKDDLHDPKTHRRLMREFYKESDLNDAECAQLDELVNRYVAQASMDDDVARNKKWTIKRIEFDNTFAYGKNNVINFENLGGITGLFGKNRTGKSSIPGTIMYGLFNTTDRGPIKNLHVINSRKGHCKVSIDIGISGQSYRIERQSVKHQARHGRVHAVTHLNLYRLDEAGEWLDISGEQRRDSDRSLRNLIGSADDFLLTSLASQGEMNTFIKERATQRKSILTNFLDLNIFEHMMNLAKDESAATKYLLKNVPDRDWDMTIQEKITEKEYKEHERQEIERELGECRNKLQELKIILATHKDKDLVTRSDVESQEKLVTDLKIRSKALSKLIVGFGNEINELDQKIEKITQVKLQFPIDDLRLRLEMLMEMERTLVSQHHEHEKQKTLLKGIEKSVKKLEEVPCGDEFPTCKFIKDSHRDKRKIEDQTSLVKHLQEQLSMSRKTVKFLQGENLQEKLGKYDKILQQASELKVEKSQKLVELHENESEDAGVEATSIEASSALQDMRLRMVDGNGNNEVILLKEKITRLAEKVNRLDGLRLSHSELIGLLSSEIEKLEKEKGEHKDLLVRWKTYNMFMNAVSKKGIPLQIITSQLPLINSEIAKILQGVTGFTVELETDPNSNAMDIYINYGDSRRIIECASGMEKMMASLAIRVALINVSSLPKTDMLIIDEGFGALDETNIAACNALLESLKKWFKNILVISHVDAVKDAVDNVLDISSRGKNAQVICK
jgi:DNA repair exonuclease SbcCD ATPase subunit/DNA repair exonuclease SbcCD nuclease subunit